MNIMIRFAKGLPISIKIFDSVGVIHGGENSDVLNAVNIARVTNEVVEILPDPNCGFVGCAHEEGRLNTHDQ